MTSVEKLEFTLDFVSDPICPWCFVGFRALDWAVMALSFSYDVSVRYRPYRLDPDTPREGRDRAATLARKVPDAGQRAAMHEALLSAMQDVGVSFDPNLPQRVVDTTDAHRLIRWAHDGTHAKPVMEGLFEAYWIHGEDLSQTAVLAQIAGDAGLDPEDIADRLATGEDRADVAEEAASFRGGGVDGVPTFIVNEATGFAGALPKAQLLATLQELAQGTVPNP